MSVKPLNELQPQEKGKIVRVGGKKTIRRRLMDMGVVKDAEIIMQRVAPLGDPVEIKIKGYDLALRLEEAAEIKVETGGSL
jgi:ferrous iron transport protein A